MEIETHVYIPTHGGMPAVRFSVKTVGRESPRLAAFEEYSRMRRNAGFKDMKCSVGWLPHHSTFVTDEKHVIDFRSEMLGLLNKYNAEICVNCPTDSDDNCGVIEVVMGEESALALTEYSLKHY